MKLAVAPLPPMQPTSGVSGASATMSNGLGRERYVVRGGAVIAVSLAAGDRLEIIDPEGRQPVHLLAVAADGYDGENGCNLTASLGIPTNTTAATIAAQLQVPNTGAAKIRTLLQSRGVDLARAAASELLSGDTPAGANVTLTCEQAVVCLIAAPGTPMPVTGHQPPTDLMVFVHRHAPMRTPADELPPPLADSQQSLRVHASTAIAYEVKAGDFIQIVDVSGRQCSDFQCFDQRQLQQGRERFLSATTTRSLMGQAYPRPGLFAKFYDIDFQPLVELVQDTCGRHDSFGLACTSKYYDEAGYPGHVNCSENFNRALRPYPITPRRGWQAMNLFFNTFFDDGYTFTFDDPWSRPGDYVLMQVMTDLICVSSACPCDIDPANGWQPTDIHVRVYAKTNFFQRAIAYRKTAEAAPQMTTETSFHSRTARLTRNFTEYNGYWLANHFTNYGATAEYWACRQRVVVTDLSPLRKYEVTGPDAELLLQTCVTRDLRKLAIGQVVYTAMCYESGGMIDDGTVFKLAAHNFRWVGGSDDSGLWLRQQATARRLQAWVKDSTAQLHNLQVQGPNSVQVLKQCIWTRPDQPRVDELAWFRFAIARIGDADGVPIICSRTGYTGERGYEIFCHPRDAEAVWDAIWEAGQPYDMAPLGLEALDLLRIEAGLIFAGYEFCDQTDPYEAGIGFTVPIATKSEDFIGRIELLKRHQNPQQKLVGLELVGEEVASHGDGVYVGREQIGVITSGMFSPYLRKNIALCRIKVTHAGSGGTVEVGKLDGHQKRIPATVTTTPHFDPQKKRVRGLVD